MDPDKSTRAPGANWVALQKKLSRSHEGSSSSTAHSARKKRKLDHTSDCAASTIPTDSTSAIHARKEAHAFPRGASAGDDYAAPVDGDGKGSESVQQLRRMVLDEVEYTTSQKQPGKYLAVDCEMVGVGWEGSESVLARVSLVNFHGFILLDEIVRPRERVVDYRTEFSGIRPADMVNARPFEDIQKKVADLLQDRILVGHAVHNDLKALLLSHPRPHTRDTQILAYKHKVSRGRCPALRHLVQQELGLTIQSGEHSSVTDARATMALFRLHRKTWEKTVRPLPQMHAQSSVPSSSTSAVAVPQKRRRVVSTEPQFLGAADSQGESGSDTENVAQTAAVAKKDGKAEARGSFSGGGRRGVSSGLSTVTKRVGSSVKGGAGKATGNVATATKEKWWKELGGGKSAGSKGSMRMSRG